MTDYRYFTADLLTGNVLADLPLYGVYATKKLSSPGDFTGTYKLDSGNRFLNQLMLESSVPGRTALYFQRDSVFIWGGILWSRSYGANGQYMQLFARTFDSYFDHMVFMAHFIRQKVNQEVIFQGMVDQLQAQVASNIGLIVNTPLPVTNMPRTILVPSYEYHFAAETVQALITADQGLEYVIDVNPTGIVDKPEKRLTLGFPLGGANPALSYDFPGSIHTYWMPESGANGGVKFATLGFGTGNKVARATFVDQDAIDAGFPAWWRVDNYSSIADLQILRDKAQANARTYAMPFKAPTFELHSNEGVDFTGWNDLGDTFGIHIEDVRYPDGYDITSRMTGWEFTPASTGGPEVLRFTIDGADVV